MQHSILKRSECAKYDYAHFLLSPYFFLADKLKCWKILGANSRQVVSDCFLHVQDKVKSTSKDEETICYDLTHALPKFLDFGEHVKGIGSAKKIAQEGDFIISRMRSYLEEMGIVEQRKEQQLLSTEFLIFRATTDRISTYTLFALCMTEVVQTILKRGQYGTGHPRFYDFLLENLPIPDILFVIDRSVKEVVENSLRIRQQSRNVYAMSEDVFCSDIGFDNYKPKHHLTFIESYSDTKQAGRIDAEYYQPKYKEIVKTIQGCSGGWDALGNLVTMKKCVEVGSSAYLDEGIPFVRVSNLSPFEITEEKYITEELYHEVKRHQPEKGEILFSKDGTPGIAYYLSEAPQSMIPSSGILRLKLKSNAINNEYLMLALNSILTKEQINRDAGGSVILHWQPDQVKEVAIPILPKEKQTQIQKQVIKSIELRKQSKHLLNCAKQAVEVAIEKGEKTAMSWLEKNVA